MEVYNRLNDDLKDRIDNYMWECNKPLISPVDFLHRRLKYNLYRQYEDLCIIGFEYNNKSKFIDWLCWDIIRPNIYEAGDLPIIIRHWVNYLEGNFNPNILTKINVKGLYVTLCVLIRSWANEKLCCLRCVEENKVNIDMNSIIGHYVENYMDGSVDKLELHLDSIEDLELCRDAFVNFVTDGPLPLLLYQTLGGVNQYADFDADANAVEQIIGF